MSYFPQKYKNEDLKCTYSPYRENVAQPPGVSIDNVMFPRCLSYIFIDDVIEEPIDDGISSFTYIAEGRRIIPSWTYSIMIYINDNLEKGEFVEEIAVDDWERLALYAPHIVRCINNVVDRWSGIGVPLNFEKLLRAGDMFICNLDDFNSELLFPVLERTGNGFIDWCYKFNKPLNLPEFTTTGQRFFRSAKEFNSPLLVPKLVNLTSSHFMSEMLAFNQNISFPKLVITASTTGFINQWVDFGSDDPDNPTIIEFGSIVWSNSYTNFLGLNTTSKKYVKVRFLMKQMCTAMDNSTISRVYRNRDTDNNIHEYVSIELPFGSDAVDTLNNTWAGHKFREVKFI